MGGDRFTIVGDSGLRNIVIVNDNQGQIMNESLSNDGANSPKTMSTSLITEDMNELKKTVLFLRLDYGDIQGDPSAFGP